MIGKGGFGKVYKGFIDNESIAVAIKRRQASRPSQGQTEFAAEIETLTKFRHRNLVSLIGYCDDDDEMILVYDCMSKGTLADHLHNQSTLSWNERLKICIGAGRGLDYLHSDSEKPYIHRDVKPTNILLDENFTAKVSDFGLAKHLGHDILQSYVFTKVKGSFGNFDPSYFSTGVLTKGSDTYAFGIILSEVLSGRRAVEEKLAEDEVCMSIWAQDKIRNGKADQIVASNLKGEISENCLKTVVGVVKRCLHPDPKKRLTMTRVVAQLELALEQQERKGTTTQILQFWPFWNRVIPSGSTSKYQNKVEVDKPSKAIPDGIPFILFGEAKDLDADYFSLKRNEFAGVLKNGENATIERIHYMPKHEFELRAKDSKLLSMLKHENVVELVEQVLAYDFAPRGSMHDILHEQQGIGSSSNSYPALTWCQRIQIALGVARGLWLISWGGSHRKLQIRHNHNIDVYNFGEILFELLTGSKITGNTRQARKHHVASWLDPDKVHETVDGRLKGDYPPEAVKEMARVAQLCLQDKVHYFPEMSEVVRDLELCLGETH
ncbi:probable serine/threonine-protein kinase PBL16 [Salvia hispanica]|uniref:probable serine/threonine-protein kinase PBL16 n=1 Tax=Salvia hispanica TaxID=49212 RepID=UPI002009A5F0|nr:probable serine/threonine-protein kinase PBL16 [Salvia hispanica]